MMHYCHHGVTMPSWMVCRFVMIMHYYQYYCQYDIVIIG